MKKGKIFIIYFPVILVVLQVIANVLWLAMPNTINRYADVINTFIGTNILFSVFLCFFTFVFRFSAISRVCAIVEVLFAGMYLITSNEQYNTWFQITVGVGAILYTHIYYVRKFPLCSFALTNKFFEYLFSSFNPKIAGDRYKNYLKTEVRKDVEKQRLRRGLSTN